MSVTGNPVLIQSTFGETGNFELVCPAADDGIFFMWRDNDDPAMPWGVPPRFARGVGRIDGLSMIQSNFGGGNLELIARNNDRLLFFWRSSDPPFPWGGPFEIARGAAGNPILIQSSFGEQGNFELVYPSTDVGMEFMWRNNDDPNRPWGGPFRFGQNVGHVEAVTMIQSNFGGGNLELIARVGDRLHFFFRESNPPFNWGGPFEIASGAMGNPVVIQSSFGETGNFELVYPSVDGGLNFMWRNNDDPNRPWSGVFRFGQEVGRVDAITLIQSNFGPGNLELIARVGDQLHFFWREANPPFTWHGPFGLVVPEIFLRATQRPDGRFIEVDGFGFSPNAQVDVSYDIFAGGAPTTHEFGTQADTTNGIGIFHDENHVDLAGDIAGANVGARDLVTNTTAVAAI